MRVASKERYENLKKCSPTIFTTLNMLMGIIVIHIMVLDNNNWQKTYLPFLIIFAGLCDCVDGKVARKFNAESLLGKQLDSLADSISFGLAPVSLVIFHLYKYGGFLGIIAAILFPIAGIYRLARFNITQAKGYFEGLPIPVAGVALAIKHLIFIGLKLEGNALYIDSYITSLIMILISFLMVSRIRFIKI